MYAIFESGGLQFMAEKDLKIRIPRLEGDVGTQVSLDRVLMLSDGGTSLVGRPYIEEASVKAKLVGHGKHEKRLVYKYKKRKNYRRKRGHRQDYSEILVTEIIAPALFAREEAPMRVKAAAPAPAKKVVKKKPAAVVAKVQRPAKKKPKPAGVKVTKRTARKKEGPAAAKPAPKKGAAGRVMSRLRRKREKER